MNRTRIGMIGCVAALLLATSLPVSAAGTEQLSIDQQVQMVRSLTEAQRQATVAANVVLTEGEATKFWPIYREYRLDVSKINDKLVALIKDYSQNFEAMTDAKAKEYTTGYLDVQKQRVDLKSKYVGKFDKVLTPIKTARVLQIETKLDSMVEAGLAKTIPLVTPPGTPNAPTAPAAN